MAIDVFVELKAVINEFTAKMGEARAEMTKTQKHGEGAFKGMAAIGQGALLAVGGAAVAIGVASIHMADQWEESHARLKTAVENTGPAFGDFKGQVSQADKAMENFGFNNAATEAALANLTTATGDPNKAFELLGISADVARFKHVDLATAATAVAKGFEGQLKPLKALGIDLPVVASSAEKVKVANEHLAGAQDALNALLKAHPDAVNAASKSHVAYEAALKKVHDAQDKVNNVGSAGAQIIDGLKERLGGQAKAATETFAGKLEVMKARVEDVGVQIGLKLIPIITTLAGVMGDTIAWFEKHRTVAIALAAAVGGVLLVAIGAYIVSMTAAAVATLAATWPILAIIAAVALVAVGIFELATHWREVWAAISGFVTEHVHLIAAAFVILLGPIGLLVAAGLELATHWHQVWTTVRAVVFDVVSAVVSFVTREIGFAETWWHDHMQSISEVTKVIWTVIKDYIQITMTVIRDIITTVINAISATWQTTWNVIKDIAAVIWQIIKTNVDIAIHVVLGTIGIVMDLITGKWGQAWRDIKNLLATVWNDMIALLGTFVSKFFDIGKNILQGMWDGIKSVVGSIISTIGDLAHQVISTVLGVFGIHSPSSVFFDIGIQLIKGLEGGIVKALTDLVTGRLAGLIGTIGGAIGNFFSGGGGSGAGGNVTSWLRDALQATGAPILWLPMLQQMVQLESGGDPHATNRTSAGLAAGGPEGLLQTIPATFGQYALPGHDSIFNPIDNAIAAIRYIQSRYGSPLGIPGIPGFTAGAYHGYDQGGWLMPTPPGMVGMYANRTGQPEWVTPPGGGAGGVTVNINGGTYVGPGGMRELIEIIRTGLYRRDRQLGGGMGF